jgi:hypothetical protein
MPAAPADAPRAGAIVLTTPAPGAGLGTAPKPPPPLDGRPPWTSSRRGSADENARRAFHRNGDSFGPPPASRPMSARRGRSFDSPPARRPAPTRRNGDVLIYHPASNTFAVASRGGDPRGLLPSGPGRAAYWEAQKARETQRRTARAGADRPSEGRAASARAARAATRAPAARIKAGSGAPARRGWRRRADRPGPTGGTGRAQPVRPAG